MGLITETLFGLLRKQLEAHCTLVWYDPELAYQGLASSMTQEQVAGATVYRYDPKRGFIWLRHQLEPRWAEGTSTSKSKSWSSRTTWLMQ